MTPAASSSATPGAAPMTTKKLAPDLLPFHLSILEDMHDPRTSELLLIARGLGLRKLVVSLMQMYDSPDALVLLVNANSEEETGIGEELGLLGVRNPGLRIVGYEMGKKKRQELYKKGGLISVTSRILVVDMLQEDIPVKMITGIVMLHAEKVTAISLEAFIVRLYREKNVAGFLKAFSDQPEHFTSGLSPLTTIMKELYLRKVYIYPRFHETVKQSVERRRADVVELYQPMTEMMADIHHAIIQCMGATLNELKRANSQLDLDDFTLENSYFRAFDQIVRRQLDPVWHKVAPKTKQLIGDLTTLRDLLSYLLSYDPFSFHGYLETILEANTVDAKTGNQRKNQSPWLYMDSANVIFMCAKRRCYIPLSLKEREEKARREGRRVINVDTNEEVPDDPMMAGADDDEWDAMDEAEGLAGRKRTRENEMNNEKERRRRRWIPDNIEPVLEELPKWGLVKDVLEEIEQEIIGMPLKGDTPGTNTVLIMTSSTRASNDLKEYLSRLPSSTYTDPISLNPSSSSKEEKAKERATWGRAMMESRLKGYLAWKALLGRKEQDGKTSGKGKEKDKNASGRNDGEVSEALKMKDKMLQQRALSRRRVRGGSTAAVAAANESGRSASASLAAGAVSGTTWKGKEIGGGGMIEEGMRNEAGEFAAFLDSNSATLISMPGSSSSNPIDLELSVTGREVGELVIDDPANDILGELDIYYGIVPADETVIIRTYSDDGDDAMLKEVNPRFIIMYEPNFEFIRRIEVYRSANPGLAVRVYFLLYHLSCEEHKYLAGLRKEKESFERLIQEKGTMVLPLHTHPSHHRPEGTLKTLSSRHAGGSRIVSDQPQSVIVDMREFLSTLPSLLHASGVLVIPATLTVGDYILSPEMCVERKSIPDLYQSFNSGRLYTQCELMSVHYKYPILLIEFEEHKSFSLEVIADLKAQQSKYTGGSSKCPKKSGSTSDQQSPRVMIQAKIILLTLSFPRLRIIWSSSPFSSADIFRELKTFQLEPSVDKAILIGADSDPDKDAGNGAGSEVNGAAEDLLRCFPGITSKNVGYVMRRCESVRALCEKSLEEVQDLLGVEPGKQCYDFIHRSK